MYVVPGMTLIPQTKDMSCWYASAQMVIAWRRDWKQSCEIGILDPSEDFLSESLKAADTGITNDQIVGFAVRLGLEPVPPMSPSEGLVESWLRSYGPLWVNGVRHITVIAGIKAGSVYVYDPAPKNIGKIEWRSIDKWYVGDTWSGRDTSRDVQAVFLHNPL